MVLAGDPSILLRQARHTVTHETLRKFGLQLCLITSENRRNWYIFYKKRHEDNFQKKKYKRPKTNYSTFKLYVRSFDMETLLLEMLLEMIRNVANYLQR